MSGSSRIPADTVWDPTSWSRSEQPTLGAASRDDPTLPSVPRRLVGAVVGGRYRVERLIGQGGMGSVYAATDVGSGQSVAVKVLPAATSSVDDLRRFDREARALAALRSPHVVRSIDFGAMPDGSAYLVMELLSGRSLGAELAEHGAMTTERVLRIGRQLCIAAAAAHAAGVVHRDLKPDNVFLIDGEPAEHVKVLDFGVAQMRGAARLTKLGTVIGTPRYMSPEQCMAREVDGRSDVYAIGCLLYDMACGRPPFVDGTPMQILQQQVRDVPPPPSTLALARPVGGDLERVILRCLEKSPMLRYQSVEELEAELARIAGADVRQRRAALVLGSLALALAGAAVAIWAHGAAL